MTKVFQLSKRELTWRRLLMTAPLVVDFMNITSDHVGTNRLGLDSKFLVLAQLDCNPNENLTLTREVSKLLQLVQIYAKPRSLILAYFNKMLIL